MHIPSSWHAPDFTNLSGLLMVVGAPDAGKSTFARYLYEQLAGRRMAAAFLDGDPGQSALGPPATITLAFGQTSEIFETSGISRAPAQTRRWFIGSVSPRGHMLPMLVGAARLVEAAQEAGAAAIVYDTDGLIDAAQGGLNLKLALIALLRPSVVFAIQIRDEMEALLQPLRSSRRTRLVTLAPSAQVQRRDPSARQEHRARQFAAYFAQARGLEIDWRERPVFPRSAFSYQQLLALEDAAGYCLGLGIVLEADMQRKRLNLFTPIPAVDNVDALHLGDLTLDPHTCRDQPLFP